MISRTPWIERKFNFDYPVTHFPFFLERLRGTVTRVEAMIRDVADEELGKKQLDKWSVKEHIGHITDLEELHERRLHEFILCKDKLSPADMTNQKTYDQHHNDKPVGKLLNELSTTRSAFIEKLEKLNEQQLSRSALHPRLMKPMRLVDLVYFVAEHDDHHLTIMRELLE